MNFNEFYKLLDEAITKEHSNIIPSKDNYNTFIFNRYLSFYHPEIAIHISKTSNRNAWIPDGDNEDMAFKCIKSILPKLPKHFIDYVKKPITNKINDIGISEVEIMQEAKFNECSKREILDLINYAKRS